MADEIRTSLGFEASQAIATLARLASELATYNASIKGAADGTSQFNVSGSKFDSVAAGAADAVAKMASAAEQASNSIRSLATVISTVSENTAAVKAATSAKIEELQASKRLAESIMDLTKARQIDIQITRTQAQEGLKATLIAAQAARATEAARQKSADPLGLGARQTGQAAIEDTIKRIRAAQDEAAKSSQALKDSLRNTENQLRQTFRGGTTDVQKLGTELQKTGKHGKEAGERILLSWQSVLRIFAIQIIHRVITEITQAFAEGARAAVEYQIALAEIQTIGQSLNLNTQQLSEQVRSLSEAFAQPLDIVSEGVYQTLSNQVAEGANTFKFVADAAQFATATVTDNASAVELLSSVLNAYSLDASEAANVSGKLFKTIELGRVRAGEMADTFGRVAVLAAESGVSLNELLTSIATLTVTGLKYNEAYTLVNNTILKLIKPSENLKDVFDKIGVASGEAGIQAFGFQGFLEKIAEVGGDTASELGGLFNQIRAIRGVLGLTGQAAETFNEVLEKIKKASGADIKEAFEKVFDTDAKRFQREMIAIKNLFTETFGGATISTINSFFAIFDGGVETVTTLIIAGTVALAAFGSTLIYVNATAIAAAIKGTIALTTSFAALNAAVLANPFTAAAAAAIALGTAVAGGVIAYNHLTTSARETAVVLVKESETSTAQAVRNEQLRRSELETIENDILAKTQQFLFARQALFLKDAEEASKLSEVAFGVIGDQISDRLSAYDAFVEGIRNKTKEATDQIKELSKQLLESGDKLSQFRFDRSLKGLTEIQEVSKRIERSQDLIRQSNEQIRKGNFERAEALRAAAENEAKSALSTADSAKNAALISKAYRQTEATLVSENRIIEAQIAQQERGKVLANSLLGIETQRSTKIAGLKKLYEDLTKQLEKAPGDPKIDIQAVKNQLVQVGAALEQELQGAGAKAKLFEGIDKELAALRQKMTESFREPFTGIKIPLSQIISFDASGISELLKRSVQGMTEGQKLTLKDLGIEIDTGADLAPAQEQLVKIKEARDAAAKASIEQKQAQGEYNTELITTNQKLNETALAIQNVADRTNRFRGSTMDVEGFRGAIVDAGSAFANFMNKWILGVDETKERTGGLDQQLLELGKTFEEALKAGDTKTAAKALTEIENIATGLTKAGFPNLGTKVTEIAASMTKDMNAASAAMKAAFAAEALGPLENNIKNLGGAFGTVSTNAQAVGPAAQAGTNQAIAAGNALISNLNAQASAAAARNAALAAGAGGGSDMDWELFNLKFGGKVLQRAFGGLGTDQIATALTRGESVNTVEATRRFFPQIQAMNAGMSPAFKQQGGVVNNTVGDISINVTEASSPHETGREVMKRLNREIRRGTFTLRR